MVRHVVRNPCGSRDQGAINLRSGTPQGGCLLLCSEPKIKTKRETRKTKQEQEHQNSDPGVEPKTTRDDRSAFGRFAVRVHPRTKARPPKKISKTPPTQNTTKRTGRDLTQNPRPKTTGPSRRPLCSNKRAVVSGGLGFNSRIAVFVVFCVGGVFDSFFWRLGFCSGVHPNSKPGKCASVVFGGLGFVLVFLFLFFFGFACFFFFWFGLGFKSRPVRFVVFRSAA